MDKAALVHLSQRIGEPDCDTQECRNVERFMENPIERLSTRVLENQHQTIFVMGQRKRPRCPSRIKLVSQRILMFEALEARRRAVLGGG
jgi:hypothetical protein